MNINHLMKQAQEMQKKMQDQQEKLAAQEFEGTSGGEMIKVIISGSNEMKSVKIDPSLASKDEVDMLEDLIVAAYNDAKKKLDDETKDSMSGMMGGMPPGLKF
ncbi:MAG: YbaB/EbfC family nucleoid-associated protein [Rickettsiales bacterium]